MAITSVRCPVAHATVTVVTDFEGQTSRVVCPELNEATRVCRLKANALNGGRLSQLLERLSEETLTDRTVECHLC